ncbi:MAG: hypothetical protein ACFWUE_00010 [Xylanivirga thermophila]|jgi:hypothetical protein|uniref:acyltransferase family protein n=1 Tax=Xylanivirga thermophila TaxID=2496273 RepID=UPI0039F5A42D
MKKRDVSIDILKGFLTIGMIICHCMQFFSDIELFIGSKILVAFFNTITFSGFVFAFGYTSYLAYFSHNRQNIRLRMLKNAIKTLIAFYISGILFRVLFEGKPLNISTILPIIGLFDIPGWSEFLISFTLFTIIEIIFYDQLKKIIVNKQIVTISVIVFLLMCFIPYERVNIAQIGLLIGTTKFAAFPIVQYMPFYIIGMYFAKNSIEINRKILILSAGLTACTVIHSIINKSIPERFPPSLLWIIAPCFILYLYYILSKYMVKYDKLKVVTLIGEIGENSLFFLLLSNIFIFALAGTRSIPLLNTVESFLIAFLIIMTCLYITNIIRKNFSTAYIKKNINSNQI